MRLPETKFALLETLLLRHVVLSWRIVFAQTWFYNNKIPIRWHFSRTLQIFACFVGVHCNDCAIFVRTETLSHLHWEVLARVCLLALFENTLENWRCLQSSNLDTKIVSRETLQKPL